MPYLLSLADLLFSWELHLKQVWLFLLMLFVILLSSLPLTYFPCLDNVRWALGFCQAFPWNDNSYPSLCVQAPVFRWLLIYFCAPVTSSTAQGGLELSGCWGAGWVLSQQVGRCGCEGSQLWGGHTDCGETDRQTEAQFLCFGISAGHSLNRNSSVFLQWAAQQQTWLWV